MKLNLTLSIPSLTCQVGVCLSVTQAGLFRATNENTSAATSAQMLGIFQHLNPFSKLGVCFKTPLLESIITSCPSYSLQLHHLSYFYIEFSVKSLSKWQHTMTCFTVWAVNGKDCWKQDKAPQTLLCWLREMPLCGEWVSSQDYK